MDCTRSATTVPSGVYIHPVSITLSDYNSMMLSKFTADSAFELQDHYAILKLDMFATSEEIKEAFRRLRGKYYAQDCLKYRALQAAYEVLVDKDARWRYDTMYRKARGFPAPPPPKKVDIMVTPTSDYESRGTTPSMIKSTASSSTKSTASSVIKRPSKIGSPLCTGMKNTSSTVVKSTTSTAVENKHSKIRSTASVATKGTPSTSVNSMARVAVKIAHPTPAKQANQIAMKNKSKPTYPPAQGAVSRGAVGSQTSKTTTRLPAAKSASRTKLPVPGNPKQSGSLSNSSSIPKPSFLPVPRSTGTK